MGEGGDVGVLWVYGGVDGVDVVGYFLFLFVGRWVLEGVLWDVYELYFVVGDGCMDVCGDVGV